MNDEQALDRILNKYVRVWIWSILVGGTTALSYSFIGLRSDRAWGVLVALPLALMVIGAVGALGAWLSLLRYLRYAIIPMLFGHYEGDERRAIVSITQAYQFLMIAGVARLFISIAELLFVSFR